MNVAASTIKSLSQHVKNEADAAKLQGQMKPGADLSVLAQSTGLSTSELKALTQLDKSELDRVFADALRMAKDLAGVGGDGSSGGAAFVATMAGQNPSKANALFVRMDALQEAGKLRPLSPKSDGGKLVASLAQLSDELKTIAREDGSLNRDLIRAALGKTAGLSRWDMQNAILDGFMRNNGDSWVPESRRYDTPGYMRTEWLPALALDKNEVAQVHTALAEVQALIVEVAGPRGKLPADAMERLKAKAQDKGALVSGMVAAVARSR